MKKLFTSLFMALTAAGTILTPASIYSITSTEINLENETLFDYTFTQDGDKVIYQLTLKDGVEFNEELKPYLSQSGTMYQFGCKLSNSDYHSHDGYMFRGLVIILSLNQRTETTFCPEVTSFYDFAGHHTLNESGIPNLLISQVVMKREIAQDVTFTTKPTKCDTSFNGRTCTVTFH